MFKNVLVGVKEGADPQPLLALAREVAPAPARIHLVTLVRVGTEDDEQARIENAQGRLDELAAELRGTGYDVTTDVSLIVLAAGADLVKIAGARGCDLIVLGLAKRTRVGKALMGSDAQRVLLSADCPVIVTRTY